MKIISHCILFFAFCTVIISCKKDNYDAPEATLSGRIVYKGEPLNFEYNRVNYELYQPGFGKTGPIGSVFTPEGGFSHVLFDGNYKLVVPAGQGPFVWKQTSAGKPDSVAITLKGSSNLDIEVLPYFMIRTPQLSFAGGKVTGTCKLEKIVTDANAKTIERVTLYISKLQFADSQTNVATANLAGSAITDLNNVSVSVTVPALVPTQNYVFARIGVKFSGVDDMIFGPTVKLSF
ncbi:DUF3823 domain-containing protein [Daejeonella sp.]|uniref:DUF3823 domain-containing protein n=1 Tax=Daejeonella sp. TaxID=2805397 RepID=UPI0030C39C76